MATEGLDPDLRECIKFGNRRRGFSYAHDDHRELIILLLYGAPIGIYKNGRFSEIEKKEFPVINADEFIEFIRENGTLCLEYAKDNVSDMMVRSAEQNEPVGNEEVFERWNKSKKCNEEFSAKEALKFDAKWVILEIRTALDNKKLDYWGFKSLIRNYMQKDVIEYETKRRGQHPTLHSIYGCMYWDSVFWPYVSADVLWTGQ